MRVDPDAALREAAVRRARERTALYDDLVPRDALLEGFIYRGARISFGSLYKGIHRGLVGPVASDRLNRLACEMWRAAWSAMAQPLWLTTSTLCPSGSRTNAP
jgi:hypothetical protein